jgi:hypothetical protein
MEADVQPAARRSRSYKGLAMQPRPKASLSLSPVCRQGCAELGFTFVKFSVNSLLHSPRPTCVLFLFLPKGSSACSDMQFISEVRTLILSTVQSAVDGCNCAEHGGQDPVHRRG